MNMRLQSIIALTVCGMFLFLKYITQLFPSLIGTTLMEQYHMNGLGLAILASSYYYSYTVMQIASGVILDKYNLKYAATLAILFIAIGLYAFTHAHSLWAMCLSRVLMGIGCSFATTLYMKAASLWTPAKAFSIISSFLATATMVGAAVGSAPVAFLFQSIGWHQGLLLVAYIAFALSFLAWFFVRQQPSDALIDTPSVYRFKEVLFNKDNLYLLLYSGFTFSPVVILGGLWGVPYLQLKFHAEASEVAKLMSLMFLGHAVGSPIWAIVSSYLNNKKHIMMLANVMSCTALSMILYAQTSYLSSQLLFFTFGFSVGAFMLSFDICRQINSVAVMGFAVAFINSGEGIVSSVLEPSIGIILDWLKPAQAMHFTLPSYQLALGMLPLCYVISTWTLFKLPFKERNTSFWTPLKLRIN